MATQKKTAAAKEGTKKKQSAQTTAKSAAKTPARSTAKGTQKPTAKKCSRTRGGRKAKPSLSCIHHILTALGGQAVSGLTLTPGIS